MTFGEKLKEARQKAILSQEELAQKLNVSRSAVAKWETDKGLPDIPNLKQISAVLNVSIDYLLDERTELDLSVTRKTIDLSQYERGRRKVKKDKVVRAAYPNAVIHTLLGEELPTKAEKIMDTALWLLTPFLDLIKFTKSLNHLDKEWYLVHDGEEHYLVLVTDEFLESRRLAQDITDKRFEVGGFRFTNCGPIVYA